MIQYQEYTLTRPPFCPTNQDHLTRDRAGKPRWVRECTGEGAPARRAWRSGSTHDVNA